MSDHASWDDQRLLRSRAAPEETFAAFYRRHVRVVLAFYAQRGLEAGAGADLTAETFAAALLARYRYKGQRPSARPWLLTIASNKLVDHLRDNARESAARERLQLERVTLDATSQADFHALGALHGSEVEEVLRQLPAAQRAAVEAHVLNGDSYAEIAERAGVAEGAVRKNVSRGLGRLRAKMERTR